MNTYLIPWHSDSTIKIKKINARNFKECEEKLKTYFSNIYEDIDDLLDLDDFVDILGNKYGVYVGEIYDINEFT